MFGERLANSRKRAGLAQVELAAALGDRYDRRMISHVERGRRNLRLEGAVNAARELGVSLDYLVGLTDDPTPAVQRTKEFQPESDPPLPVTSAAESRALTISQILTDPLLEGWIRSGEALLELQRGPASRTPATDRQTQRVRG